MCSANSGNYEHGVLQNKLLKDHVKLADTKIKEILNVYKPVDRMTAIRASPLAPLPEHIKLLIKYKTQTSFNIYKYSQFLQDKMKVSHCS